MDDNLSRFEFLGRTYSLARSVALIPIASLMLPAQTASQPQMVPASRTATDIDSLMESEMRALRIPGAAVAIVESGSIVFQKAYGIANLETETPMKTDSIFELASITKQFTAAAVMMLVEGRQDSTRRPRELLCRPDSPYVGTHNHSSASYPHFRTRCFRRAEDSGIIATVDPHTPSP